MPNRKIIITQSDYEHLKELLSSRVCASYRPC